MGKQKRYSLEFRERAVRRMKLGDNISRLARELGVDRQKAMSCETYVDNFRTFDGRGL
jgi:transposase-like protein